MMFPVVRNIRGDLPEQIENTLHRHRLADDALEAIPFIQALENNPPNKPDAMANMTTALLILLRQILLQAILNKTIFTSLSLLQLLILIF